MRSRDIPFDPRVPPKLQFRIPKVRGILKYHRLSNPTVRQTPDGELIFKVDLEDKENPLSIIAAQDQISEFLGEEVTVIDRGMGTLVLQDQQRETRS